jgi:murein DD-endopeptidase MepM/ murein hydrolase activator NlpD
MGLFQQPVSSKAPFTEAFVRLNNLGGEKFTAWVFHPDMLFGAKRNWWGSKGQRSKPHEGIDLCLYRDGYEKIIPLDERIRVPAMVDGIVVKMMPDFLGQSIILEHRLPHIRQNICLTIYGHTVPAQGLTIGQPVKQGQEIATIAPQKKPNLSVPPHLHITMAWSSTTPTYDTLDWTTICDPERLQLLDPLQFLDRVHFLPDTGSSCCG